MKIRYIIALTLLLCGFSAIGFLFWQHEYKYSLPTPVPVAYKAVKPGDNIRPALQTAGLPLVPLFLHFYNPDCPCSRFNARHLKTLIRKYNKRMALVIVTSSAEDIEKAKTEFGLAQKYVIDQGHALAKACGVYSTPQAVITNNEGGLYFRGNYNKSRYCTSKATNYAELALLSYLNNEPPPVLDIFATQGYGCELENKSTYSFAINF